ncbi:deoxycytidylate deaminase [Streptomyces sp. NPDC127112]|uniref:deoxycytidylate deaminase n=1 Tax=Streptomyces sp. NPDC127112 TaxID=3345364 RepID=UPI00362CEF34
MSSTERPDWDDYFTDGARWAATRGDCIRCKVGALVVKDNRVRGAGYNGTEPGGPSCLKGECPRCLSDQPSGSGYEDCIETHAEMNAIFDATRDNCIGATIYITRAPCKNCMKAIRTAGIARVVYPGHFGLIEIPILRKTHD